MKKIILGVEVNLNGFIKGPNRDLIGALQIRTMG
jgi:hypothetical protein